MNKKISVPERLFLWLTTVGFFVLFVTVLALIVSEDQVVQEQRQKRQPMLGIIDDTHSSR